MLHPCSAKQLSAALLLTAVLGATFAIVAAVAYQSGRRQSEREHLLNSVTLRELVMNVEAVRARMGRAPKDEAELVSLLGQPMPFVHDQGALTPLHYWRTGDETYRLHYESWATDDWIYDSTKPQAGWVQSFY